MHCPAKATLVIAAFVLAGPVFAAQRTFVSTSGVSNPACSVLAPCRDFATAVAAVDPGGEVIVLDSGGYGPVTITKSVTIAAPTGVYAGISVPSGVGVEVNGIGISVVLRGLSITGHGGQFGVRLVQGASLTVEDCEISGLSSQGIYVNGNAKVTVKKVVLRGGGGGFGANGAVTAVLDEVQAYDNSFVGIAAINGAKVNVRNSVIARNPIGVEANVAELVVSHSIVAGSSSMAFWVGAGSGAGASITSEANTVMHNEVAYYFAIGGGTEVIYTTGNNTVGYSHVDLAGGSLTLCCSM